MIGERTIYAQFDGTTDITLDHEGQFKFTIKGWYSGAASNVAEFAITLSIEVPCDNPDNVIYFAAQTFLGTCRTAGASTLCDDIHYTIFQDQNNPFVPATQRFSYSCSIVYTLLLNNNPAPAFIQLLDVNGSPAYTDRAQPVVLSIHSQSNDDFMTYSG